MQKMIALASLGFAFVVSAPVFAGAQQEKMKGCNKEAKESALAGDARKAFMSKCLKKDYVLKSKAAEAAAEEADATSGTGAEKPADNVAELTNQKDRMRSCNADAKAKDLKGDERKKFMSSCLKKS